MKKETKSAPPKRIFVRWKDSIKTFVWATESEDSMEDGDYFVYELRGRARVRVHREIEELP